MQKTPRALVRPRWRAGGSRSGGSAQAGPTTADRAPGFNEFGYAGGAARRMIFDTCEVLSEDMDRWVRNMLVPLCDGCCAILVLFGSRLSPDVGERPGDKRGWRAEIGDGLWRRVRFDRDVHFTVGEIQQAVGKLRRKISDGEAIASRLHEITRGVPLAVRGRFDCTRTAMTFCFIFRTSVMAQRRGKK